MDLFQIELGEEDETNPGHFGRAFAHWLAEPFKLQGDRVQAVLPEDWGWCVMLAAQAVSLLGELQPQGWLPKWMRCVCDQLTGSLAVAL